MPLQEPILVSFAGTAMAGTKRLATLKCRPSVGLTSFEPAQIHSTLTCSQPELRDAGYIVNIKTGGYAGATAAELSEESITGSNRGEILMHLRELRAAQKELVGFVDHIKSEPSIRTIRLRADSHAHDLLDTFKPAYAAS